jgi:Integrase core domain
MNRILSNIYYNVQHPASYSTVDKLWEATKRKFSKHSIQDWLASQEAYTLHKPRDLHFSRSRYFVPNMNNLFQADLCDMRALATHNGKVNYILTVIDVFCKKAWAVPLKKKTAESIIVAFKRVFADRKPKYLQTDKGKEFLNSKFQTYLKKLGIRFYTTNNPDVKASVVERFNRTLKTKMFKYFTHANTYKYVDVLSSLVASYNSSVHSAIGIAPVEVTLDNQIDVYHYLYSGNGRYKHTSHVKKGAAFHVGDLVRITREKYVFEKGYEKNWSTEVFVISKVLHTFPVRYKVKDLRHEDISGSFYKQELQKVVLKKDAAHKIDKVISSRGVGASRQLYVKWQGYPDKFNSWIKASDLIQ